MATTTRTTENELLDRLKKQSKRVNIFKIVTYVTYGIVTIAVVTLLFRVLFLLFSANPATPFVNMIYGISSDFMQPFRGIFPTRPVGETGYLDVSALFALLMYGILAALVKGIMVRLEAQQSTLQQEIYQQEDHRVRLASRD